MFLKKPINYLPFIAGLLAGLYFISLNVTGYAFEFFPGDFIDGRFNNYLLEHVYLYFSGKTEHFWNAPFMFPEENVITYSDNLLGSAPFYCVFRVFGADRETAFQLWYLLVTVLNYACCYLLLMHIFKNPYAAVCGALIYAFSMALHSQMGHAQTFPRFAVPLCIWMLLKFSEDLNPRYFFWALWLLAYQMYCGIYLGFLLAIPFGIVVTGVAINQWGLLFKSIRQRAWLLKIIRGIVINCLFLLPLLIPYFERARKTGFYPFERVLSSIPTPASYFFSWKGSYWWESLNETCISYPAFWDHEIFAGGFAVGSFILISCIFIIGIFYKRLNGFLRITPGLQLLLLTGIITFVIFLRLNNFTLYRIIYSIPGFGSMRALQRIINIELLFFAISLACIINLLTLKRKIWSALIAVVMIMMIIADNYVFPGYIHQKEKLVSQQRINELYQKMRQIDKKSVVSYEPDSMTSAPMDYHLDAMLASQLLGLTTLNGYSATSPGGYGPYWVQPNEENRKTWLVAKGKPGAPVISVH